MTNVNLDKLLNAVDISADWVGIRHVYEAHTPRMIRDGIPVMNGRTYTEGIMVEVLADGQFGYYGTPDISPAIVLEKKIKNKIIIRKDI